MLINLMMCTRADLKLLAKVRLVSFSRLENFGLV
jgi:hypothetical protein